MLKIKKLIAFLLSAIFATTLLFPTLIVYAETTVIYQNNLDTATGLLGVNGTWPGSWISTDSTTGNNFLRIGTSGIVRVPLPETIDISDSKTSYIIEMKLRMSGSPYRYFGMAETDPCSPTAVNPYTAITSNWRVFCRGTANNDISLTEDTPVIGDMADKWNTIKITLTSTNIKVEDLTTNETLESTLENLKNKGTGAYKGQTKFNYLLFGMDQDSGSVDVDDIKISKISPKVYNHRNFEGYSDSNGNYMMLDLPFNNITEEDYINGLLEDYSYVDSANSQFKYIQNGTDYVLRIPLSEAIDLSNDNTYEFEMRYKGMLSNYRMIGLAPSDPGAVGVYPAMASGWRLVCTKDSTLNNNTESSLSLDDVTGVGSATRNEWRTVNVKMDSSNVTLTVTDEKSGGNVISTQTLPLSALTGTSTFMHKKGTVYKYLIIGNLERDRAMTIDYIKVSRVIEANIENIALCDIIGTEYQYATPRTDNIKIKFSVAPNSNSLKNNFKVTYQATGNAVAGVGTLSADGLTYTYKFTEPLEIGGKIKIDIGNVAIDGRNEKYSLTKYYNVVNPVELLDVDYDNNNPAQTSFSGLATVTLKSETNGNKYAYTLGNWASSGYLFSRPMNKNEKYKISFDFSIDDPAKISATQSWCGSYVSLHSSTNSYSSGEDLAYNNLNLLGYDLETKKFRTGPAYQISGENAQFNNWYTYTLILDRGTGDYEIKITNRGDNKTVAGSGGKFLNESYGGMTDLEYDAFKFNRKGEMNIDNIKVEQIVKNPISFKVTTTHPGNIFGQHDSIDFAIGVMNDVNETLSNTKIEYMVTDEDDSLVDSGIVCNNQEFAPFEAIKKNITANASKFGVYKLRFKVTCGNNTYETVGYKFSIINKREANEAVNQFVGTNTNSIGTDPKEILTIASEAGISSLRFSQQWHHMETAKGDYVRGSEFDGYHMAKDYDVGIMSIYNDLNPLYVPTRSTSPWTEPVETIYIGYMNGTRTKEEFDTAYKAWLNYCDYFTKEFKGEVEYYEAFNESYSRMYHLSSDTTYYNTAVHYLDYYVKPFKEILAKNDPDAKLVGICTDGVMNAFVSSCIKYMGTNWKSYVDAISVHPYVWAFGDQHYWSKLNGEASGAWTVIARDSMFMDLVSPIKNSWISSYSGSDMPVFFTEYGIASTEGYASIKMQAADFVQSTALSLANHYADKVYPYCFENVGITGEDWYTTFRNSSIILNDNYGFIGNGSDIVPYYAKPAHVAMAAYNKLLGNATYMDGRCRENEELKVLRFKRPDNEEVIVIWCEEGTQDITLYPYGNATVYDMYSNVIGTATEEQVGLTITASFEPIYVKGSFGKNLGDRFIVTSGLTVTNGRKCARAGDTYEINITDDRNRNLNVSVEITPYVEVVSKKDVVNGSGKVVVKATSGIKEEEPIHITITDASGNVIHYAECVLDAITASLVSVSVNGTALTEASGFSALKNATTASVTFHADNFTSFTGTLYSDVVCVYYDEDGHYIKMDKTPISFTSIGLQDKTINIQVPKNASSMKFMLWDSNGDMMPFGDTLHF